MFYEQPPQIWDIFWVYSCGRSKRKHFPERPKSFPLPKGPCIQRIWALYCPSCWNLHSYHLFCSSFLILISNYKLFLHNHKTSLYSYHPSSSSKIVIQQLGINILQAKNLRRLSSPYWHSFLLIFFLPYDEKIKMRVKPSKQSLKCLRPKTNLKISSR